MSFRGRGFVNATQQETLNQNQNKISIKPVYNVAQPIMPSFQPFEQSLAQKTFTYSSAVVTSPTETLDSLTAYQIANGFPKVLQKLNTIPLLTNGDDTALETIFYFKPNQNFEITQCFLQFAVGMYLSAWTSNGATFTDLDVEVRVYQGTEKTKYITVAAQKFSTGFSEQGGADAGDVFICQMQFSGVSVSAQDTIGIYIKATVAQDATNTFQCGILPFYSFSPEDVTKSFYESGIVTHAMPSLNASAQAFKHEIQNFPLDSFGAPFR